MEFNFTNDCTVGKIGDCAHEAFVLICAQRRLFDAASNHSILIVILPVTLGKSDDEDWLWKPTAIGQVVCVQRSSVVGVKGIPLNVYEYFTVPCVTSAGTSYSNEIVEFAPITAGSGQNARLGTLNTEFVLQFVMLACAAVISSRIGASRNILYTY
jgi:hypothetical protein